MKKFRSRELIDHLEHDVRQLMEAATYLQQVDKVKLAYPAEEGQWSAVQALEHVNMYNRHYLPVIEKSMSSMSKEVNAWFIPGWVGNFFTLRMLPKTVYEVKKQLKAPKAFKPSRGIHVESVLKEFLMHQTKWLFLLQAARKHNLEKIRIPVSLLKIIRLKLGDAFRFLIAHEQRHMLQARNTIKKMGVPTYKFPVILEVAQL